MNVTWFLQSESDVPATDDWLSPGELSKLSAMRFSRRRADWRLGRWTAKRALAARCNWADDLPSFVNTEIRSLPNGAPEAFRHAQPIREAVSLSHRAGWGLCAVAPHGTHIGCDLELIECRSQAFVEDYFTGEERILIEQARPNDRAAIVSLLWSAKESVLKAMQAGLTLDTREVTVKLPAVNLIPGSWERFQAFCKCASFFGWYRYIKRFVVTVAANEIFDQPIAPGDAVEHSYVRAREMS
jgi:4'-phosphopantetheinyl transferase